MYNKYKIYDHVETYLSKGFLGLQYIKKRNLAGDEQPQSVISGSYFQMCCLSITQKCNYHNYLVTYVDFGLIYTCADCYIGTHEQCTYFKLLFSKVCNDLMKNIIKPYLHNTISDYMHIHKETK